LRDADRQLVMRVQIPSRREGARGVRKRNSLSATRCRVGALSFSRIMFAKRDSGAGRSSSYEICRTSSVGLEPGTCRPKDRRYGAEKRSRWLVKPGCRRRKTGQQVDEGWGSRC
jgi:hypothetical protein